jgi:predicted GNAT family acetyltransferase
MDVDIEDPHVRDNPAANRFEIQVGDEFAILEYARRGPTIGLIHTYVPPSLEHHGLAAMLSKFALDYARGNGLKVAPVCPYVAEYVRNHREYDDILAPIHTWEKFFPMSVRW